MKYVPLRKRRWGMLPVSEDPDFPLHSRETCARCGSRQSTKHRTVLVSTNAIAYLCDDNCACVRRRSLARKDAA